MSQHVGIYELLQQNFKFYCDLLELGHFYNRTEDEGTDKIDLGRRRESVAILLDLLTRVAKAT